MSDAYWRIMSRAVSAKVGNAWAATPLDVGVSSPVAETVRSTACTSDALAELGDPIAKDSVVGDGGAGLPRGGEGL